jgi:hypothetical protein
MAERFVCTKIEKMALLTGNFFIEIGCNGHKKSRIFSADLKNVACPCHKVLRKELKRKTGF